MGFLPFKEKLHSNSVKSNVRKGLHLSSMLVFAVFFSSIFFVHSAFAVAAPGCGFFDISLECDLSGWMKLFLGDILIASIVGGLLALLFHRFSIRTPRLNFDTREKEGFEEGYVGHFVTSPGADMGSDDGPETMILTLYPKDMKMLKKFLVKNKIKNLRGTE